MLLLEALLLLIFLVLDILMFYIFFESILAPLFILIGIYGSSAKIRASFYFFLYFYGLFIYVIIYYIYAIFNRLYRFLYFVKDKFYIHNTDIYVYRYIYSFCSKNTNYLFK